MNPYVPTDKQSFLCFLEELLDDYEDAERLHGSMSKDVEEITNSLIWICEGAQKAGYIPDHYEDTVTLPSGKQRVLRWYKDDLVYWENAYFDIKEQIQKESSK